MGPLANACDSAYNIGVTNSKNPLPTASQNSIEACDLNLRFGDEVVLRDISLLIPAGCFVSIVGPSGCGKTSLLRLVAGLQRPTSGELRVMSDQHSESPRQAFVFQDPHLLPWRNVVENVQLPLELSNRRKDASQSDVDRTIKMVGLKQEDREKFPHMLSGGMKMRVSLARALVNQPELLLFDEPFAALDDLLRQRLNEDLTRLWQENRWTVLFVTHNVSEAVFLSERVLVLDDRPATIQAQIDVPFSYPRSPELRGSSEFVGLTTRLSRLLRGEHETG